jgi:hypothetical protein
LFLEIPLYHVLTAKVTFGNIHGIDKAVEGVSTIKENSISFCAVDENIFAIPAGYRRQGLSIKNINEYISFFIRRR